MYKINGLRHYCMYSMCVSVCIVCNASFYVLYFKFHTQMFYELKYIYIGVDRVKDFAVIKTKY